MKSAMRSIRKMIKKEFENFIGRKYYALSQNQYFIKLSEFSLIVQ
jgi:hypothetical protein